MQAQHVSKSGSSLLRVIVLRPAFTKCDWSADPKNCTTGNFFHPLHVILCHLKVLGTRPHSRLNLCKFDQYTLENVTSPGVQDFTKTINIIAMTHYIYKQCLMHIFSCVALHPWLGTVVF